MFHAVASNTSSSPRVLSIVHYRSDPLSGGFIDGVAVRTPDMENHVLLRRQITATIELHRICLPRILAYNLAIVARDASYSSTSCLLSTFPVGDFGI